MVKTKTEKTRLPKPYLGSILVELIQFDAKEYLDKKKKVELDKNSVLAKKGFETVHGETDVDGNFKLVQTEGTPIKKGKIVDMASDCFGEAFKRHYGEDTAKDHPVVGDTIYFIPGKFFEIDFERKYGLIRDEDVKAIEQ